MLSWRTLTLTFLSEGEVGKGSLHQLNLTAQYENFERSCAKRQRQSLRAGSAVSAAGRDLARVIGPGQIFRPQNTGRNLHEVRILLSSLPLSAGQRADCLYLSFLTTRSWLSTEKTPDTPLAFMFAIFLSASLSTTPTSVTFPLFTMI